MKNTIFTILFHLIIIIGISAQSTIDLSSLPTYSENNIVDEVLKSEELISQMNALDRLINRRSERLEVDVIKSAETFSFGLSSSNVAEKINVQYGLAKPVEKTFNCYGGNSTSKKKQSNVFVFSDELGNFGFSFEQDGLVTSLVKEIKTKNGIRYSYSIKQLNQENETCSLTHENTVKEEIYVDETKNGFCNREEYIIQLGAGTDFEYLVAENFNTVRMLSDIIDEARSVAIQYASCDMRVAIRLINIVIEIFDDSLWPTPYCLPWGDNTKALSYNQVFASSPARPNGDVITLFTGTDLKGVFCLGDDIGGMANLINGACGFRKTNVAEHDNDWNLWAHEIGHVIGIGINHGNLPNGFFYSGAGRTLRWHHSTVNKVQTKMKSKSCIQKVNNFCMSNFSTINLCANQTTFCVNVPASVRLDISSFPSLSFNATGQLCGTVSGSASYNIPQLSTVLGCSFNTVVLRVNKCQGSVINYALPPYDMHELCYTDFTETCYNFNCISSWEIGSHTGLFVNAIGGRLCVTSTGKGGPGPKTLNIRPTFSCGVVGDWLQWTINVVNCLTDNDKDDTASSRKSSSQTTIKFINATSVEIRNNDSSVPTLVEFFTLAGQKIGSQSYNSNGIFNLPELPAGITLGVFYIDGKPVVRKIIN